MGQLIGVSEKAWQGYELGDNLPGGTILQSIARLGFNINWLLTGEGPMHLREMAIPEGDAIAEPQGKYRVAGRDIDVAPEHESVFKAFAEVMASNYEGVKIALTQNTFVFQEAVQNAERIEKLERDIKAIKEHLMPRETDFKSQGQHGEEKNAGGGEH